MVAMARCCFVLCVRPHRIHPMENIVDVELESDEESDDTPTGEDSIGMDMTSVENLYHQDTIVEHQEHAVKGDVRFGETTTVSTKMETQSSYDSSSSSHREQTEITALHAAAVNGDKSSLAKLLSSNSYELDSGDKFGRTPLMYCILGDRLECAEMLIKASADLNKQDMGGRTALHWAAHKGNFKGLKMLISRGASWKAKDNEGQSPMHLSTRHKSAKCLVLIMKQLEPGEVDNQDNNKRTALHWAASYGNLEHVRMLIKQDSNIGIPDVEGKTPLHWAASSKDDQAVDCVRLILETTPSVINWQDFEGRTALHLAVADGNEAVVQILRSLEKCNVSALDNMFRTPLHWAAVLGHSQILGVLLECGADYTSSDSNGATPLHYAAQNNYDETVEVFLRKKGLKDEPDIEGRTAFMWAAGKGADKVINKFIEYKVEMVQTDKTGGTALHAASLAGHASTVKLLLENGSHINMTDLQKHTPLFRACEMGHMEVVQTLIDHGARVDIVDQDGRTPLHWAALGGHAYICQTVIKYGMDSNVRDNTGRTPIQCAAYGGFVNCMSVLIEHKADANSQDNEGMTALHWACSKGHSDAIKLLIEFHAFPNHMEFTEDRYTPLDYALMGEHYEVAQYMIEQGALSITGIQDIAAVKIQAVFRAYRVRKTFLDRKRLLMKHEQLRKDAAKKKAEEEHKRKKQEVGDRPDQEFTDQSESEGAESLHEGAESTHEDQQPEPSADEADTNSSKLPDSKEENTSVTEAPTSINQAVETNRPSVAETNRPSVDVAASSEPITQERNTSPASQSQKKPEDNREETVLNKKKENHKLVKHERQRLKEARRNDWAAKVIQQSWKRYISRKKAVYKNAQDSIREKRLEVGEEEWCKQIAALTIQLSWRKYYRRKLLKSLTPKNRRILHMWNPDVIAAKQMALVEQVYGSKGSVPLWQPKPHAPGRPVWFKLLPSPAAVSFNFAVGQYYPHSESGKKLRTSWSTNHNCLDITEEFGKMAVTDSLQPHHFSYNMYDY